MENATKALLIAAAVLIVILVIALGMRIFRSSSSATGDAVNAAGTVSNATGAATTAAANEFNSIMDALK